MLLFTLVLSFRINNCPFSQENSYQPHVFRCLSSQSFFPLLFILPVSFLKMPFFMISFTSFLHDIVDRTLSVYYEFFYSHSLFDFFNGNLVCSLDSAVPSYEDRFCCLNFVLIFLFNTQTSALFVIILVRCYCIFLFLLFE